MGAGSVEAVAVEPNRRPTTIVFFCTLIGAVAQVLIKMGANGLTHASVWAMLASPPLFAGYALYGVSTIMLVWVLKHGELSLMWPIISLTYIWVAVLSVPIFHYSMNRYKVGGILLIAAGVALLGRGSRR